METIEQAIERTTEVLRKGCTWRWFTECQPVKSTAMYVEGSEQYDSIYYSVPDVSGTFSYGVRVSDAVTDYYVIMDNYPCTFPGLDNVQHCAQVNPTTMETLAKYVLTHRLNHTIEQKVIDSQVVQTNYLTSVTYAPTELVEEAAEKGIRVDRTIGYANKPYGKILMIGLT